MKIKELSNTKIISLLFLLSLTLYVIPIISPPIMVDRALIITPLEKISSFEDYYTALKDGTLYDFQPLRDLSHILDINISKSIHFENVALISNLIILFFTSLLIYKVLCHFFDKNFSLFLVSLFLFHPSIFNTYVEFTSRKHLLSFMFMLLSYSYFLKDHLRSKKNTLFSLLFYAFSILSHPINAFIIILFSYHLSDNISLKGTLKKILPFLCVFLTLVSLNLIHYHYLHYNKTGLDNFEFTHRLLPLLNAFSMHHRQFFIPIFYSRFYDFNALSNLIMLLSLPILYMVSFSQNKKLTTIAGVIILSTFLALYGHKSNVLTLYYQNTYGLTTFFAFLIIVGAMLQEKPHPLRRSYYLVLIPLFAISLYYSSIRKDEDLFNRSTAKIEPSCRNYQGLVTTAIKKGYIDDIKEFGSAWLNWKCRLVGANLTHAPVYITTFLILNSEKFSIFEKKNLFQSKFSYLSDKTFLLAFLEYKEDPNSKKIYTILEDLENSKKNSFFLTRSYIGQKLIELCKKNNSDGCKSLRSYNKEYRNLPIDIGYFPNIKKETYERLKNKNTKPHARKQRVSR